MPRGRPDAADLPSPWYVTGFVETAGSFTYSRTGRNLAIYFAIKLPARDHRLLEAIRRFFGDAGTIYEIGRRDLPARAGAVYLRVSRRDELARVVAHFDRYPRRGRKLESYRIWREMVRLKADRYRRPPRERLGRLANRLSAAPAGDEAPAD